MRLKLRSRVAPLPFLYNEAIVLPFSNLIQALDAAPGERPFVTAWIDEDEQETVTFAEFRRRARSAAGGLKKDGLGVGDRVVLIMPQSISAMTTFVGAMMLGAVPAFLAYPNFKVDPAKYRSGLAGVTANLAARMVVIDQDFPDEMLDCVSLGEGSIVVRAGDATGGEDDSETAAGKDTRATPDDLAFIQHSAGTTGLQKGVALSHGAVLRQIEHLRAALHIDSASDRIYSWLPLYHDMGLIACFMLPLVCHLPLVMQSPLEWVMHPETMLEIISRHKCTLAWLPNFAFQFIPRRMRGSAQYDLSSVRALINCSEPVRGRSMDEFYAAFAGYGLKPEALQSSYAMAETVFAVSQSPIGSPPERIWADGQQFRSAHRIVRASADDPGAISLTSSGRLLPNVQVRIAVENGPPLGDGCVGEILVRSDCLFSGYYHRPDLTGEALVDGWYRTGDLGFLLDGEIFVVGRKKDLIIVGGENLYPQDIEEIVGGHPEVCDGRAIAMGVYNPDLGTEEIVAVAEVRGEELLAGAERIEREIRSRVVAALGVSVRTVLLKPPRWIVKSTAGKPARSATREKLFKEHPELANGTAKSTSA